MADNTRLNPGAGGDLIATDELPGGEKVARSKVMLGANGQDNGDVSLTNPMPVKPRPITFAAPTFAAVATTSTEILAANSSRRGAIIVNDSDEVIYLGIGAAAVVGSGVRFDKKSVYSITFIDLHEQVINGIHAGTGTKNVTVQEAT